MTYTQPLLFMCIALLLAGLLTVRRSKGRKLALLGVFGLLLISWPPADWLLGLPLEARYPVRAFEAPAGIQAIVVLGSAVRPPSQERPYPVPDLDTFRRCEHAAWIYRRWGPLPVLACEGRQRNGVRMMSDLLRRAGVPENMIWVENQSRSTHENALYGAQILQEHGVKRIALVVEAQSMLRAAACFRKEGFDVTPAPTSFRTFSSLPDELIPNADAIRRNEITLHEMVGLLWYRWRGWI
jgi:uncharacterized SAM-binding protein YcdF (DUF218 family)